MAVISRQQGLDTCQASSHLPPPLPAHAFLHISACKGLLSQRLDLLLWGGGRCLRTPFLARVPHSQA